MQALMDAQRVHVERQAAALAELRTAQADGLQRLEVCLAACVALSINKKIPRQHASITPHRC